MNDFGSKIYAAAQKAVKEVYDLDVAEASSSLRRRRTPSWVTIPPALR